MEAILNNGLALRYGLSAETVRAHADAIWNRHAHAHSTEEEYWTDWEAALGVPRTGV